MGGCMPLAVSTSPLTVQNLTLQTGEPRRALFARGRLPVPAGPRPQDPASQHSPTSVSPAESMWTGWCPTPVVGVQGGAEGQCLVGPSQKS